MIEWLAYLLNIIPIWLGITIIVVITVAWMYFIDFWPYTPSRSESEWQKRWRKDAKK